MKSPFCGSVISSCFLKKQYNLCSVRWLIRRRWFIFPVATVHYERGSPSRYSALRGETPLALAFVPAEQGTANSKLVMELFVIF